MLACQIGRHIGAARRNADAEIEAEVLLQAAVQHASIQSPNPTEQLQMMNPSLKSLSLMNPNCLSRLMNCLKSCLMNCLSSVKP